MCDAWRMNWEVQRVAVDRGTVASAEVSAYLHGNLPAVAHSLKLQTLSTSFCLRLEDLTGVFEEET